VGVPAQIKEATQLPAQHRWLQLQASEEERLIKPAADLRGCFS